MKRQRTGASPSDDAASHWNNSRTATLSGATTLLPSQSNPGSAVRLWKKNRWFIMRLPEDILLLIFGHVNGTTLAILSTVCTAWRNLIIHFESSLFSSLARSTYHIASQQPTATVSLLRSQSTTSSSASSSRSTLGIPGMTWKSRFITLHNLHHGQFRFTQITPRMPHRSCFTLAELESTTGLETLIGGDKLIRVRHVDQDEWNDLDDLISTHHPPHRRRQRWTRTSDAAAVVSHSILASESKSTVVIIYPRSHLLRCLGRLLPGIWVIDESVDNPLDFASPIKRLLSGLPPFGDMSDFEADGPGGTQADAIATPKLVPIVPKRSSSLPLPSRSLNTVQAPPPPPANVRYAAAWSIDPLHPYTVCVESDGTLLWVDPKHPYQVHITQLLLSQLNADGTNSKHPTFQSQFTLYPTQTPPPANTPVPDPNNRLQAIRLLLSANNGTFLTFNDMFQIHVYSLPHRHLRTTLTAASTQPPIDPVRPLRAANNAPNGPGDLSQFICSVGLHGNLIVIGSLDAKVSVLDAGVGDETRCAVHYDCSTGRKLDTSSANSTSSYSSLATAAEGNAKEDEECKCRAGRLLWQVYAPERYRTINLDDVATTMLNVAVWEDLISFGMYDGHFYVYRIQPVLESNEINNTKGPSGQRDESHNSSNDADADGGGDDNGESEDVVDLEELNEFGVPTVVFGLTGEYRGKFIRHISVWDHDGRNRFGHSRNGQRMDDAEEDHETTVDSEDMEMREEAPGSASGSGGGPSSAGPSLPSLRQLPDRRMSSAANTEVSFDDFPSPPPPSAAPLAAPTLPLPPLQLPLAHHVNGSPATQLQQLNLPPPPPPPQQAHQQQQTQHQQHQQQQPQPQQRQQQQQQQQQQQPQQQQVPQPFILIDPPSLSNLPMTLSLNSSHMLTNHHERSDLALWDLVTGQLLYVFSESVSMHPEDRKVWENREFGGPLNRTPNAMFERDGTGLNPKETPVSILIPGVSPEQARSIQFAEISKCGSLIFATIGERPFNENTGFGESDPVDLCLRPRATREYGKVVTAREIERAFALLGDVDALSDEPMDPERLNQVRERVGDLPVEWDWDISPYRPRFGVWDFRNGVECERVHRRVARVDLVGSAPRSRSRSAVSAEGGGNNGNPNGRGMPQAVPVGVWIVYDKVDEEN